MRDALCRCLAQATSHPRVLVLTADHGAEVCADIPDGRVINVGICEQGMIGYAAGLAKVGYRPIVYGLASFVPMRCLEQIKIDLCLSNQRVILIGDGGGVVYTTLGNSHQCGEDIAALRAIPNIRIYSPADRFEVESCFREAMAHDGPSYIRIGKSGLGDVGSLSGDSTEPRWVRRSGTNHCLVAHGSMVSMASKIKIDVMSIPRIKPLCLSDIKDLLDYKRIVVVEEHSRYGGLFSAVCELLSEDKRRPEIHSVSMNDQFTKVTGSYDTVLRSRGLGGMVDSSWVG